MLETLCVLFRLRNMLPRKEKRWGTGGIAWLSLIGCDAEEFISKIFGLIAMKSGILTRH